MSEEKLPSRKTPPVLLPGLGVQSKLLREFINLRGKRVLLAGSASSALVRSFLEDGIESVDCIIGDQDALLEERMQAPRDAKVRLRFNDFANTDFPAEHFDVVYTQGALSLPKKTKIIKENARVLRPGGIACLGEFIYTKSEVPVSVREVWERAGIAPLTEEELFACYTAAGLRPLRQTDLSETLTQLYASSSGMLRAKAEQLDSAEFRRHKKEISRYRHEANMYLKMGGKKFTRYIVYFLEKPVA